MSGSPKYQWFSLSQQTERRLRHRRRQLMEDARRRAAERARRAAERARREAEERARRKAEERERRKAEVLAAIAAQRERCSAMTEDPSIGRWVSAQLAAQRTELDNAERELAQGQVAAAQARVERIKAELDAAYAAAGEAQLQEDRRQYVVNSLLDVFAELGFTLDGGIRLERADDPRSALMFQVRRLSGEAIAVSVPQDLRDRVWYDIAGLPRREHIAADGTLATSCDEAEAEISRMRALLAQQGVLAGELLWEGRDPDRPAPTALTLPTSAQATQEAQS
ncbi:MAG: hypothetical protein RMM29_09595 [Planctomycetota bacterium]|nr:hypothetical protein [Planctomycetota bacterium]MDW8373883.1 hypothetical protein [Planctomycetota bacterium]